MSTSTQPPQGTDVSKEDVDDLRLFIEARTKLIIPDTISLVNRVCNLVHTLEEEVRVLKEKLETERERHEETASIARDLIYLQVDPSKASSRFDFEAMKELPEKMGISLEDVINSLAGGPSQEGL